MFLTLMTGMIKMVTLEDCKQSFPLFLHSHFSEVFKNRENELALKLHLTISKV